MAVETPFSVSDVIETAYRKELSKLITSWIPVRLKDMSATHWLREFAHASTRKSVIEASTKVAVQMVTRVNVANVKSWRKAAFEAQGGPQIYHLLREQLSTRQTVEIRRFIHETAKKISAVPTESVREILHEIVEAQQQGTRSVAITPILRERLPNIVNKKIQLLARTGASAASTALTRTRSKELGLPCFVWETSHDQRVRASHRLMSGVSVFWDDLPSPEALLGQKPYLGNYSPGDCPNCRCYPRPILTLEDVFTSKTNVIRVYRKGSIELLNRTKFANLSGIESRLAA